MDIEKNRIELYQTVMIKDRYNKITKQKFRVYTKDYSSFIKQFFDKETNTDSLYSFLVAKKVYRKSKTDFYKTFACDLDWAKELQYCPKPITDKERFGASDKPTVVGGGVTSHYYDTKDL